MSALPKMLVVDLDGSALRRDHTVAPRDVAAVQALRARGVHVSIATGRLFAGTQPAARALGITGPVACMNGSEIRLAHDGARVSGAYLPDPVRTAVRRVWARSGVAPLLFASHVIHHNRAHVGLRPQLRAWTSRFRQHAHVEVGPTWMGEPDLLGITGVGAATAVYALRERIEAALADIGVRAGVPSASQGPRDIAIEVFPSFSTRAWYLVVRDGVTDKGTALHKLAAASGVTEEDCVVLGDWMNDAPMFARAGRSFAMGQAHPTLKEMATDCCVATSETGGGIAEVAERVWGVRV